ncbi:MAG: metal-dependent phosphoesterase, partial [Scytonema sp. CRU_2_7]|nr:metal-dependent phosphoesterase [Scytonema sp. CRU_2_7]
PMTAGSDAHHVEVLGVAYTILDVETLNVRSVLNAIKKGPALQQSYMTPKDAVQKNLE